MLPKRSSWAAAPAGRGPPPTRRSARCGARPPAAPAPPRCSAGRCRRSRPAGRPAPAPPPPPASRPSTSSVVPVVDLAGAGGRGGERPPAPLAQLRHVLGVGGGAVDPFVQPGVQPRRGAADRVPLQGEAGGAGRGALRRG